MKALPEDVKVYKRTPPFSQDTIPAGLLKSHSTKAGTWGKICVTKGKLLYVIEGTDSLEAESIELSPSLFGVVEPEVIHHVMALGEVDFYVEFYM